jgi:hypothetical protein
MKQTSNQQRQLCIRIVERGENEGIGGGNTEVDGAIKDALMTSYKLANDMYLERLKEAAK